MTTQTLTWVPVISPRGTAVQMAVRDGTSDLSLVYSSMRPPWVDDVGGYDEYGLLDLSVSGVALDIGACIGSVAAALLADNPDASVIALEPLPENCELMEETRAKNGWGDRWRIVQGAIGPHETVSVAYGYGSTPYGHTNRYIGNLAEQAQNETHLSIDAARVTLADLVGMAGGEVSVAKLDCEGCEWSGLTEPAVANIAYITGEWHGDPQLPGLHRLLDATHDVTGVAQGVTGIFRAVRR